MNSSIRFITMNLGRFIARIKVSQVRTSKFRSTSVHEDVFLSIVTGSLIFEHDHAIYFISANSEDSDEMLQNAAFHQNLHCLPKEPFKCFQYKND